ncbi:protein adenylyltransferase SelO family protein [Facilibium subflavum]|uniref:protein adenylyltransferase SelO family protein n=1 Tax=Facilibium subflavum TaxID=2219058 RepID=UPI001AACE1B0|nr:protein adenylyltransferase SelO family protein [Facilibium subflavum]
MHLPKLELSYTNLPECFYSKIQPAFFNKPKLVVFNTQLADHMDLDINHLSDEEKIEFFFGQYLPQDQRPIAQAYAGHQFGHFTLLGDGRAFLLGEHVTPDKNRVDLHLKGIRQTPYARGGDGKAVIGPMLREYIISEAMHALQIPTTRALAVILTGEKIQRDGLKPGAILVRVAKSHIRVGTFQFARLQGINETTGTV